MISQAEHFCFLEAEQQAIIVHKIIKAGFSMDWVSALDAYGARSLDSLPHCDGKYFVVRADEKLTAFVELQSKLQRWITLRSRDEAAVLDEVSVSTSVSLWGLAYRSVSSLGLAWEFPEPKGTA